MGVNGAGWMEQEKLKDNKHRKRGLAYTAKTADCGRADAKVVRDPKQ